jgi:hypothetical protein
MMDRQCPSCGGFCKKSKCERENVAPTKREWVGLTDEEKSDIDAKAIGIRSAMYLTEAKLKEKNHG